MSHVIDTRLKPVVSGGPRAKPPSHMLAASVGAMRASVCRRRRCARASVPCAAPRRMRRCVRAYDITWWDRGRPFQVRRGPTRDTQATWCSARRVALLCLIGALQRARRHAVRSSAVRPRLWRFGDGVVLGGAALARCVAHRPVPPPEAGAAAWPEERWRQVLEEDARTCACVRRMRSRARNTGVMVPTSIGLG